MALQVIEAARIFDPESARLGGQLIAARAAGELALPQLVGVTTCADHRPIDSYTRGLHNRAALIDPRHQTETAYGRQLFQAIDCKNEREASEVLESLADEPGVGVLLFRPFRDEAQARRLRLTDLVPNSQNVDGQVSNPETETVHMPATVRSVLRILDYAHREEGGLRGIKRAAVIGDGPAVGRRAKVELEKYCDEVVSITLEQNRKWLRKLGAFDVVVAAAGGGPKAAEIIEPGDLSRGRRFSRNRRPPLVVVDAACEFPEGEEKPQGNLHRDMRDPGFQKRTSINAIVAPIGVVSKGAQTEIFHNTFNVSKAQANGNMPFTLSTRQ